MTLITQAESSANCRHAPGRCKSDLREKTCACIRYDAEDGWNEPPIKGQPPFIGHRPFENVHQVLVLADLSHGHHSARPVKRIGQSLACHPRQRAGKVMSEVFPAENKYKYEFIKSGINFNAAKHYSVRLDAYWFKTIENSLRACDIW